jgi:protein KRI1
VENWDRIDEDIVPKPVQSEEQTTRKSKKKSKLRQAIAQSKPIFDPSMKRISYSKNIKLNFLEEKSFEQYFDEYYKLDCEDFIGDMPIRFQYRQVEPNDFGLSVEEVIEILMKTKWY